MKMDKDADKFSIYVVEDDDAVLRSLCALLIAHGFETVACTSDEQFLDRYDPAKKAFMILDLRLPGMSGLQLQTHLNELNVKIPIVVVTGHGDVPIAVQAMRAGAVDFIE
jgi:two-component system response regulator FixJ